MNIMTSTAGVIDMLITRSNSGGHDVDGDSETLWRKVAMESWYKLHPGVEPADGDIPTPGDIVANVGNAGPLATGPALSAFLGRWNQMMAGWVSALYEEASRDLLPDGSRLATIFVRLGKGHPDWALFVLVHFIRDMTETPNWAQDMVSSGLANKLDIPMTVTGWLSSGEDGNPAVSVESDSMLLDVCAFYDALPDKWKGEHPVEPLIQAWQALLDREKIRRVEVDHRTKGRVLPGKLAMVDQGYNRAGQTWSPAAHLQGPSQASLFDSGGAIPVSARQVLPGFGDRSPGRTPALFLQLWDLGAASVNPGGGQGAPLALRLFVEAILAVPKYMRGGRSSYVIPLRQLQERLYPNGPPTRRVFWDRLTRAIDFLQSLEARMPYRDPSTGEYRLLQIVSFPDLPDGPDDLNQEVEIGIRLPPNSHGGPQISDNLGWWGVSSVPAYRALLNLAYYWHMPGRRKYQHEDYEPLTDDDLIELCYPAGISAKQRRKKLQEAKKTLGLLADAGELAIVPYGTSGRERRILPVQPPSAGN
jgi:hypothetical protein